MPSNSQELKLTNGKRTACRTGQVRVPARSPGGCVRHRRVGVGPHALVCLPLHLLVVLASQPANMADILLQRMRSATDIDAASWEQLVLVTLFNK